ncbi:hypothetical protein RHGRI_006323 [Rhododendron griersonianum]|uniref:AAA+ ATPase domain-containing protein n=1 Tax=Rhododendron griersonianum TaxID=479676 RepID=A0AAV6KT36_9ERIC|nr:hypothetical protein RHGRI_006323 [Rhododendron griersonianum]
MGDLGFEEAIKAWKYVRHYTENLQKLQVKLRDLDDCTATITREVSEAIGRDDVIEVSVSHWQMDADSLKVNIEQLIGESTTKANISCIACSCPNVMWRYKFSKQTEEKMTDADALIMKYKDFNHQISHPRSHYRENLQKLKEKLRDLDDCRETITREVSEANGRGDEIEVNVLHWQTDAGSLKDDIEQLIKKSANICSTECPCPDITWQYEFSKQAEEKIAAADELIIKYNNFNHQISHPRPRPPELESLSDKNYVNFDSRASIFKDIMDALKDSNVNMIGVFGLGGVGKTTLVKEVAEQMRKDGTFKQVAIAVVSKDLNVKEVQSKLADSLNFEFKAKADDQKRRATELWNKFTNGDKYLIILDDIWEGVKMEEIGIPCTNEKKGCKVVLTSRKENLLSTEMEVDRNFSIAILSSAEAWTLFMKKVGNSIQSQLEIKSLAYKVCKRCKGLPVAINALGEALKGKQEPAWKTALNKLDMYMLKNIVDINPSVFASLKVSYDMLHPADAKSCFLLCCLFAEDAEIPLDELTRFCFAGSFLAQKPCTLEEARNEVYTVVDALKSASLLSNGNDENVVKIHHVIRDVGISIAREEEAFLVDHGALRWPQNPPNGPSYSAISLIFKNINEHTDGLLKYLFSPTTARGLVHLEVLEVTSCEIMEGIVGFEEQNVENEITGEVKFSKLKQLELTSLPNLISFCAKKEKMGTTMGSFSARAQPLFNELVIFPVLERLTIDRLGNIIKIWDKQSVAVLEDQGSFCQLTDLEVRRCSKLMHVFPSNMHPQLKNLEELEVEECETMKGIVEFEGEIDEDGHRNEVASPAREHLEMVGVTEIQDKQPLPKPRKEVESLCRPVNNDDIIVFPRLKDVSLDRLPELKSFYSETQGFFSHKVAFPVLERLSLLKLGKITRIWDDQPLSEPEKEAKSFSELEEITVGVCDQLEYVFPSYMVPQLKNLQELNIWKCRKMEMIISNNPKEKEATNNNHTIRFPQLKEVSLQWLPNLISFICSDEMQLFFSNKNNKMADTSAAQARKGKDIQEIPWERLNITREKYRQTRLEQYENYENIPQSGERSEKDCKVTMKGGMYYEFRRNSRSLKSTIPHFQLRNLVWATSKHDVYLMSRVSVTHWSALTCNKTEVLNVSGHVAPCEKHPGSLLEGFTRTRVSTLAVKDRLLVVGGFQGELICKNLDRPGVCFCTKTTYDDNAVTNAVEIYSTQSGAVHFTVANNDCGVRDFDMENFQLSKHFSFPWPVNVVASLVGHLDFSFASAWHPDGLTFATGNQDKTCRIWDARNLSKSVAALKGNLGAIQSIRYSSDGRFMAMAEPADFVHVFNAKSGYEKEQEIDFFGEISGMSFSPDTESLFIGVCIPTYGSLLEFRRQRNNSCPDSII